MARRTVAVLALVVTVLSAGCFAGVPFADNASGDGLRFREVGTDRGFTYNASRTATFGNGRAGVYVTDFDGDGWPDVLATGGQEPVLFENTRGAFAPTDALPALEITVKGALFFDYDNDGWEDLLLLPINGSAVFLENRDGRFRKREVGLDTEMHVAIGASAADYDRDGCLDLFVVQSGDWQRGVPAAALSSHSRGDPVENDNGNPNLLFEGSCESFERVDAAAGIDGTRWSLATSFVDLTGDGFPDVHVGNDFNTDVLYENQHNGTFARRELSDTDRHAMASEVADISGDGRPDVFVSNIRFDRRTWMQENIPNMGNAGNNLLVNRGNGTFVSAEREYGVRDGGWGWAAAFADLDNDGDRDLVHATKSYLVSGNGAGARESVETPPRLWERTGANFTRLNASAVGFESSSGRGLARLDYDRDGDQDIVVANHDGEFKLYENRVAGTGGHWLQVELVGGGGPVSVLGSQVSVTTERNTQHRVLNARADFLSQDTRTLHFGLSTDTTVSVRVVWPDGTERTVENIEADRRIAITRNGTVESTE